MGDEENFDLDDDLGLDDDGGGDDFEGSLDDALGGDLDDGGGDAGGGGDGDSGDSELDSFFEDLSSIEDMDEGGGGDEAPAAQAAPAQAAPAQAAPAQAAPAQKSGGKGKWIVMILVLLLGAGGGAFWWFFMNEPEQPVMEEMPAMEDQFKEEVVRVEQPKIKLQLPKFKQDPKPQPQQRQPEPEPEPPPVEPMAKKPVAQYLVQVATCSFDSCKEDYAEAIRQKGEPVYTQKVGEKFDFIELITTGVYNFREAKMLADKINMVNSKPGQASVAAQSNGYRVTMGTFPALDRAKDLKFYLEKELQKDKVRFNLEHVRKDYESIKVYAGPYDSRGTAKKVLAQLRKDPDYSGSFLVRF